MREIHAIALNTFREAIRNRIFASLILFAVGMLLFTLAISSASLHEEVRLMKDIGLFLISLFSVLLAIFVGVNLLYLEIERKTIYTVMPKPIYRAQFLLGKYVGLAFTMLIQVAVMGLVLAGTFVLLDARFGLEMVQALWLVYIEVLVVMGIAMVFSSFSTPFLSGLLTLGVFAVGRFADRLLTLKIAQEGQGTTPTLQAIETGVRAVAHVAPDLSIYNSTPYVVYQHEMQWAYVGHGTLYGLTYAGIALVIAMVLFQRRDFV